MTSYRPWRMLGLMALVSCSCLIVGGASADEAAQEKGKGKGKKSLVVEVDLKKLPPELAREVLKYVPDGEDLAKQFDKKGKGKGKGKDKDKEDKAFDPKSKDKDKGKEGKGFDPKGKAMEFAKGKGKGKKGDEPPASNLDRILERLAQDIEELRRELRRK